ncbi:ABC transporter permease [Ruminococcus flavefaciens]|uniref:ABC transporter permease n=1 Tax=Ruminococcus flavefaciens TaxID=1265 RepID=UPI0015640EC6|nr:FtsX-like permease family protein [Ruminococcus flavefaciens]
MLFKISLSNIRKSLKDYAVYFFTLVVGVAVFYVFNAIETQTAFLSVSEDHREFIKFLVQAISAVSVFVAIVLGLLIVYASRFLMKRRNKEFALYMMLGMSKWKISALLLCETVMIGIGSLFVGLLIGVGLSQVMSAVVANLFEADMTEFKFTVSGSSIAKTIIYFSIMYAVVIIRSGIVIGKCRLITLMQSGRRSEKITMKNPWLCVIVFLISAAVLGYAYYMVGWNQMDLGPKKILAAIIMGAVSTFFIFWSVAGMLLRVIMSVKGLYHRGLNSFTFRQISSKVNTTVASMTVICLMLFVTICTLSSAFVIRNNMNRQVEEFFPVDFYGEMTLLDENDNPHYADIVKYYEGAGFSLSDDFKEYHEFHTYFDPDFTMFNFIGDRMDEFTSENQSVGVMMDYQNEIIKLSDYNALMKLYDKKPMELSEDEYAITATFSGMVSVYDWLLADKPEITVFGNTLKPRFDKTCYGYITPEMQPITTGVFVVPDSAVDESGAGTAMYVGNYNAKDKNEIAAAEKAAREHFDTARSDMLRDVHLGAHSYYNTKIQAANDAIDLGALVTFLGLYIGFIFLVSCGAILALKELSESSDSASRYTMLRKLGVEEKEITGSVFTQSAIFFALPLLLACLHSYFGMRLAKFMLSMLVSGGIFKSMLFTAGVVVLIYGGYFLLTFIGSRAIVREQK